MKAALAILVAIHCAVSVQSSPVVYQCAPIPMTNAEWRVTYAYAASDGLIKGSNALFIGPVDMVSNSVVSGHMEIGMTPRAADSAVFFANYAQDTGFKMEWVTSRRRNRETNRVVVLAGAGTNGVVAGISYSVRWEDRRFGK